MHLVKFSFNGQQADMAQSTVDVEQSACAGAGQRVGLGIDVALTYALQVEAA